MDEMVSRTFLNLPEYIPARYVVVAVVQSKYLCKTPEIIAEYVVNTLNFGVVEHFNPLGIYFYETA